MNNPTKLMRKSRAVYGLGVLVVVAATAGLMQARDGVAQTDADATELFIAALLGESGAAQNALATIKSDWQPGYAPMVLETIRLSRDPSRSVALLEALGENTGKDHGFDLNAWNHWLWNEDEVRHASYPEFKSTLYGLIDPKFSGYFVNESGARAPTASGDDRRTTIRLDEVVWGGVRQDGIPPLRGPKMIAAAEADYLEDDNVVFAIEVEGDARAYPKRILAWHEMFTDTVGGVRLAGVYCTLCGSVILYETELDGVKYDLGTSGFLYRSNKLMYDRETQSLWNTLWGKPAIGPLVDKNIKLKRRSVVTTTWGEWRRRHPDTTVLSLDTGHQRDYGEGVAYQEYFATDDLMFEVPEHDNRLANKDEVLALLFAESADAPLAIAAKYLDANTVHHDEVGGSKFVVITDPSGANRVYESGDVEFAEFDGKNTVKDASGNTWDLSEKALTASDGRELLRLPAHRAFWFGWYGAYPHTRLVM